MADEPNENAAAVVRSLDSTLESVDAAEEIVVGVAQSAGVDEDGLMQIGMAVREAMVNAVVHGNRYHAGKKVGLAIRRDPGRLLVTVTDEGEGFDTNGLPDPTAPENLLRASGRGILLMRSFMDEVQIRRRERAGMEVVLIKHVAAK